VQKNQIQIKVTTPSHEAFVSITDQVVEIIPQLNIKDGFIHLFVLHTTCSLTINENADPDVTNDIQNRLRQIIPWKIASDRHLEGNSAAHLKCSLIGSSLTIPIENSNLVLGTWQGIYLAEFDGSRTRKVHITAIRSN